MSEADWCRTIHVGILTFRGALQPSELPVTHKHQREVWRDLYSTSEPTWKAYSVFSTPPSLQFLGPCTRSYRWSREKPTRGGDCRWFRMARQRHDPNFHHHWWCPMFPLGFLSAPWGALMGRKLTFQHGWHFTGSQGPFTYTTQIKLSSWHTSFLWGKRRKKTGGRVKVLGTSRQGPLKWTCKRLRLTRPAGALDQCTSLRWQC